MIIDVKCLKDYEVNGEILFTKGSVYKLRINDFSDVRVFYDANSSTKFIGSLNDMFTNVL